MTVIGSIRSFPNLKDIQSIYIPDDLILNTLGSNITFLSDFIPADIHLYKISDNNLKTLFEAKPSIYPSFYRRTHISHSFPIKEDSIFFKVIETQSKTEGLQGQIFNGLPIYQIAYPIFNKKNKVIGILLIEKSFNEQNRWGLKNWLYDTLINNIIDSALENSLVDTTSLPSIYPGDGIIVIDSNSIINYSNYPAINISQIIGLNTPLEGEKFEEVFNIGTWRLLELNSLYGEQDLHINDYVINVKTIPLETFFLIIIRDISELRHKDQEIKIKSTIIKEIHHRVKNNLQSIVSLLRLQRRRIDNIQMKEIISDSISRINSIAVVHDYLSQKNVDVIDLTEMSRNIFFEVTSSTTLPDKKINFKFDSPDNLLFSSVKAVSVALVLNEVLNNTLKHAFTNIDNGIVELKLSIKDDFLIISVYDDGIGLPEYFDVNKDGNLGWKIIKTLVKEDLKGDWVIESKKGNTTINIVIPFNFI